MLSGERVRTMTKMQIFMDREGVKTRPMLEYFRGDYVGRQLLFSLVTGTLAYLLIFVLISVDDLEAMINSIDLGSVEGALRSLVGRYVLFMAAYLAVTFLVYTVRYALGRKKIRRYYAQLSHMEKLYREEEDRLKPTGGT